MCLISSAFVCFLFALISKKTSSPQGVIVESENEEDKVNNI